MQYLIGQIFGLFSTACCLVLPLFKQKRNMLLANGLNNALVIVNILLVDGFGSAALVCAVAVVQVAVMLRHLRLSTPVTQKENHLFLALYTVSGLLGFRTVVDVLPIVGAVFNMLSTFQRDEQRTRWFLLINASTFALYYFIIGSTALFAVLCTIVSTVIALFRYKK